MAKRVRRAAPVAQRRMAGEPKEKPGASLPRSEISQFLPASRFISIRGNEARRPHFDYLPVALVLFDQSLILDTGVTTSPWFKGIDFCVTTHILFLNHSF